MAETGDKNALAERLAALKTAYAEKVPARLEEVEAAAKGLDKDGPPAREALEAIHALAHKLAGSGATFGFAALGAACVELDDYCFRFLEAGGEPAAEERRQVTDMVAALRAAAAGDS